MTNFPEKLETQQTVNPNGHIYTRYTRLKTTKNVLLPLGFRPCPGNKNLPVQKEPNGSSLLPSDSPDFMVRINCFLHPDAVVFH